MGALYDKLYYMFAEPRVVLVCGLDNAGKTSLLNALQPVQLPTTPTVGFNSELVQWGYATFRTFDVCGQDTRRAGWSMFYKHADALVFVVDANDVSRLYDAGQQLAAVRQHPDFPHVPILVLANKQDQPRAATPAQVMRSMRLDKETRPWHVAGTVLKEHEGIADPFQWLVTQM